MNHPKSMFQLSGVHYKPYKREAVHSCFWVACGLRKVGILKLHVVWGRGSADQLVLVPNMLCLCLAFLKP